jgi:3-hydroxy acid dehydrogenase / malonic semialdehyde reductase
MADSRTSRPRALVTGASRGIGRAISLRLAASHDLVLLARNAPDLEEVAAACRAQGAEVQVVVADLADFLDIARQLTGLHIDVLVNNAGVGTLKPLLELTATEWHRMVDVNVNALYHVTRAVLPGMVERGRGHVCTIGSMAGRNTFANGTAYAGTKHFVMGFSESLLMEVRERGVGVSVIMPGSVASDFFPEGTETSWMLEPDDVAEAVAYVVSTPQHVLVDRLEIRPLSPKRRRDSLGK